MHPGLAGAAASYVLGPMMPASVSSVIDMTHADLCYPVLHWTRPDTASEQMLMLRSRPHPAALLLRSRPHPPALLLRAGSGH